MFRVDLAKFDGATGVIKDGLLEGCAEFGIIEEDVRIVIPSVEVTLDGFDGLENTVQLLISCQHHECCLGPWLRSIRPFASYLEDLVVFLANFSVAGHVSNCNPAALSG